MNSTEKADITRKAKELTQYGGKCYFPHTPERWEYLLKRLHKYGAKQPKILGWGEMNGKPIAAIELYPPPGGALHGAAIELTAGS